METLKIQLLGEFRIDYNGDLIRTVGTPRLQSLLAYLLVHRAAPQPKAHVAGVFWPDSTETQARANLRGLLKTLKEALPESEHFLGDNHNQNIQWREDAPYWLDVEEFEKASKQTDSVESLEQAVDLYRGGLLPGCYDDWVFPERERLEREFRATLERLIGLLTGREEYSRALAFAERLSALDELREDTYRTQMRLHGLMGDRAGIKRVYEKCRAKLKQELGDDIEPSPETRQAYDEAMRLIPPASTNGSIARLPPVPPPPDPPPLENPVIPPVIPVTPVEPQWESADIGRMLRRVARLIEPVRDPVNFVVPVVVLVFLYLAMNLDLYLSLIIAVLVFAGLFLVLHPRSESEEIIDKHRDDILQRLDLCAAKTAQIRRLGNRVRKVEVKTRIIQLCDLSSRIVDKLAKNSGTSLTTAASLDSILADTLFILDLYVKIMEGELTPPREKLNSTLASIEGTYLRQLEDSLRAFQVKLDEGKLIELEISIQVMLERFKLEGLG